MGRAGRTLSTMNEYELMYIVPTSFTEEELGTVEKNVAQILEKNGATIKKTTRLGKLRFAYPMKHERYGHYVLLRFQVEEKSAVNEIDKGLRLSQKEVLRHLIISGEDAGEEFNLVQFQEVHVEGTDRRRRPARSDKSSDSKAKEKDEQEQKEGVAALEEGLEEKRGETAEAAAEGGIEKLSAEDLQKKIDEALDEKA